VNPIFFEGFFHQESQKKKKTSKFKSHLPLKEIVLDEVVGSTMVGSDMENFSINVEGHRAPRKRFGATSPRMKEFRGALQPLDGNGELLSPPGPRACRVS